MKKLISRLLLLLVSPICILDASDRKWWVRRFKNGSF